MNDPKNNRKKWLHIRLTEQEYDRLLKGFSSSTKRKLSSYARDLLLNKPVTVYTRDKTIDIGVQVLGELKKELSAVGNNFNQAVKRLHTDATYGTFPEAAKNAEKFYLLFIQKVSAINEHIGKIFKQWLQE